MKSIPNFTDYCATKDGRIWSIRPTKFLSPGKDKNGHLRVVLCNGKMNTKKVHRLILETFVGPCPEGMVCRHLNGNPADNRLENLRWGTRSENTKDSIRHGTHNTANHFGGAHHNAKLSSKDRYLILYQYATGLFSQRELMRIYNVSRKLTHNLVTGKQWPFVNTKIMKEMKYG